MNSSSSSLSYLVPLTAVTLLLSANADALAVPDSTSAVNTMGQARPRTSSVTAIHLIGRASYYSRNFNGRRTASGELYNMYGLTAAHRTLPFGTLVKVTNLRNNRSVIVRVNDRGPYRKRCIIDLSYGAARRIGMRRWGVTLVRLEVLRKGPYIGL